MRKILLLLKKDFIRFWRDKPAVLLTFVLPAVLIIIFGNIFSGDSPRGKINVAFVNDSDSKIARLIESKLDSNETIRLIKIYKPIGSKTEMKITEEIAKNLVLQGKLSTAIILPEDFFTDTSSSMKMKIYYDPKSDIETALLQGSIQKTIFSEIPELMPLLLQRQVNKTLGQQRGNSFRGKIAELVSDYWNVPKESVLKTFEPDYVISNMGKSLLPGGKNLLNSIIAIESEQLVGKEISNPGVTRTAGGWAMMFLLFSIVGAATSLFEEREEGSLRRLLYMPVKKSHILWSKYIYSIVLGVIQLFVLFGVAWVLFDVDIFSNFINLFIMILASAMAAVSFGMLITSFATSLSQANGISTLLILIMSAVGGAWFPITLLPEWMQTFSKLTIVYWSVEGFLQVLWRNSDFSGIFLNVVILVSTAFTVNFYALVRLRKGKIFN